MEIGAMYDCAAGSMVFDLSLTGCNELNRKMAIVKVISL